jgi:hypothetical protein
MKSLLPTTKFKVPPSHCLLSLKAVFQVAALVILASAKVPAQPTVIVVAANKAINGEPPRASVILCHPDKAAAITSPELVPTKPRSALRVANVCTSGTPVAAVFYKNRCSRHISHFS